MLMLSRLRHICNIVLVALLVMSCTSCARWREAKGVIAEADSLLVEGVIMRDTAALGGVIRTLDHPVVRWVVKEELAEAYYLMGRNLDDYYHNFAEAAEYYIAADRLKTNDLVLRGRINSCMGFLCKQDSCFAEALEFYERANNAFEKTGDKRRVANGLVSIAEQYVNLKDYSKADSVLNIAAGYTIDSAYYADILDVKAMALYNQQLYDSALVYLMNVEHYPRNMGTRCYNYHLIIQCLFYMDQIDVAIPYAEYIIEHSHQAGFKSNAYYVLIKYTESYNQVEQLAYYSYLREDEDRLVQQYTKSYAEATAILKDYISNPYPFLYLWIGVGCIILMGGVGVWIYRRKSKQVVAEKQQMEAELRTWKENILQKLDRDKEDIMNEKRMIIRNIIMEYADEFAIGKSVWDKDKDIFRLADSCFGFVIHRLKHKYNLRNSELKICLMVLLDFPTKDCVKMLSYTEKSYPTIKRRLAERLGTSSGEMRDFLIDFIAKII